LLILFLLLSVFTPVAAMAQEPYIPDGSVPSGILPPEIIDYPENDGAKAADVDATSQTPTTLVSSGVNSFSAPNPGVYWLTEAICQEPPPRAATTEGNPDVDIDAEGDVVVETPDALTDLTDAEFAAYVAGQANPSGYDYVTSPVVQEIAPASSEISPAEVDAATTFYVRRTNYAGTESRTVQQRVDNSGGQPWQCPNHYKVNSNVVADQKHLYWVDANGLVRVPVTANASDTPEVVAGTWTVNQRIKLTLVGTRLFATLNQTTNLPYSRLMMIDLATGTEHDLRTVFPAANFNSPDFDGTYVYYKVGVDLWRINTDGSGNTLVTTGVSVYSTRRQGGFLLCQIGQPCPHYVYYVKTTGSGESAVSRIYRHDIDTGSATLLQTRNGRIVRSLLVSTKPPVGIVAFPTTQLFWIEAYPLPCGISPCFAVYNNSLMRAGAGANSTVENLYNVQDSITGSPGIGNLASNGQFLLWEEFGALKRLPNDAAALPVINMRILGIEVTQGIQNNDNTVRLVRGRETWVRVFVKSDGADVPNVTMRLSSSGGGGSLYPVNNPYMTVKGTTDRNTLTDSFLFLLPSSWWDRASQSFTAILNPHQLPFEPTYADNTITTASITFHPATPMHLALYTTTYSYPTGPNTTALYGQTGVEEHVSRIQRTYPIAENSLSLKVRNIDGGNNLGLRVAQLHPDCLLMKASSRSLCAANWLMSRIFLTYVFPNFEIGSNQYHYGLINDALAFPRGRVIDVGLPLGAGPSSNTGDYGYYTAHEVGHMLERNHPTPNGDNSSTSAVEGCGHSRSDNAFPYPLARIGFADGVIRGFDRATPSGSTTVQTVLDDVNSFDVMSYCGAANLRWPSPYTWEGMYQWLKNHAPQAADAEMQAAGVLAGEHVAIFGALTEGELTVLGVQRVADGLSLGTEAGGVFTLRLLDAGNNPLSTATFNVEDEGDGGAFALVVPWVAGTTRLQILGEGNAVLWSQTISANAPTVSNVTLPGASSPAEGDVTLTWSAADADGDPLTFDVQYSTDNFVTLQPVTFDVEENSIVIDTATLPGGNARFRVIASDGANGGYADSPEIVVAMKAPTVSIMTPNEGDHFNWQQTVGFNVVAIDLQDGMLGGTSIVWTNQHGNLGTGSNLAINTLPTGENVITVTATNAAGLSASATITIFVGDELQGPPATLVATPAHLNIQVENGASDPETRTLDLGFAGTDGGIAWTATSDKEWVTLNTLSGGSVPASITLSVDPSGLASNALHLATITLVGTTSAGTQTVVVPVRLAIGNTNDSALGGGVDSMLYLPTVSR